MLRVEIQRHEPEPYLDPSCYHGGCEKHIEYLVAEVDSDYDGSAGHFLGEEHMSEAEEFFVLRFVFRHPHDGPIIEVACLLLVAKLPVGDG